MSCLKDFKFTKLLGRGSFGAVYQAHLVKTKRSQFAVKEIKLTCKRGEPIDDKALKDAITEVEVLAAIYHPSIISYYAAFVEKHRLYIVTELMSGGDLSDAIRIARKTGKYFSENAIWSIAIQMLLGLNALHQKNILHRDIKAANVFLDSPESSPAQGSAFSHQHTLLSKGNLNVKLGDLGVARVLKNKQQMAKTSIGTPYYVSPEIWRGSSYNAKSDIWSVGCLLYELVMLKHPFNGRDMRDLAQKVLRGRYRPITIIKSDSHSSSTTFGTSAGCSLQLSRFIDRMLQIDPRKRPSCDVLLDDPIVKSKSGLSPVPLSLRNSMVPPKKSLGDSDVPGDEVSHDLTVHGSGSSKIQKVDKNRRIVGFKSQSKHSPYKPIILPSPAYTRRQRWEKVVERQKERLSLPSPSVPPSPPAFTKKLPSLTPSPSISMTQSSLESGRGFEGKQPFDEDRAKQHHFLPPQHSQYKKPSVSILSPRLAVLPSHPSAHEPQQQDELPHVEPRFEGKQPFDEDRAKQHHFLPPQHSQYKKPSVSILSPRLAVLPSHPSAHEPQQQDELPHVEPRAPVQTAVKQPVQKYYHHHNPYLPQNRYAQGFLPKAPQIHSNKGHPSKAPRPVAHSYVPSLYRERYDRVSKGVMRKPSMRRKPAAWLYAK
ncbi:hypothetical protein ADUPG1_013835 [Aduncisulcus paluster]|uniref:non-specific serine/threonine protein kinase n=1 Tax=Aduncisulcus paluster TaxID=2918883 RepID=A0ABQ5K7M0_9EUKA|nr:hypothetical protein ADUPG1_013835 [Aduncisulcus paluster]